MVQKRFPDVVNMPKTRKLTFSFEPHMITSQDWKILTNLSKSQIFPRRKSCNTIFFPYNLTFWGTNYSLLHFKLLLLHNEMKSTKNSKHNQSSFIYWRHPVDWWEASPVLAIGSYRLIRTSLHTYTLLRNYAIFDDMVSWCYRYWWLSKNPSTLWWRIANKVTCTINYSNLFHFILSSVDINPIIRCQHDVSSIHRKEAI